MMLETITLDLDLGNAQEHEMFKKEMGSKILFLSSWVSAEGSRRKRESFLWLQLCKIQVFIARDQIKALPHEIIKILTNIKAW